ncbi:MAG: magnesium-dependent phosphatase-1 [Bacteroidetes bacterium]|jgi:magnesium-dependent phosphatase 1|nr:magnesium-dependent phosphatase-1 [Bacteroidota bacterium]
MELFVFDLDFTLWNTGETYCSETIPPYKWHNGLLYDDNGNWLRLYPETPEILKKLRKKKKTMAIASRSYSPPQAKELLDLFAIDQYFAQTEIFPGDKIAHLNNIQKNLNIPFEKMVFFDDEQRNINDVGSLGVTSILVPDGIRLNMIEPFLNK